MIWSHFLPWRWARGKAAPLRRSLSPVRLQIELLEERLVPSTTTGPLYQQWSQQTFRIDDQAPTGAASVVTSQAAQTGTPQNSSFGSLIGLSAAFSNYSYRGQGESVAVIDTGIDYMNPDLGGGFGPGYRVIAGYNFVNNSANPMDDNGHGTAVAGEIGSSNANYSGVAPDVNLIALKVLDSTGSGSFGAIQSALDWVVANQAKYNIVAINMSLGSGNYTINPYTFLDSDLSQLTGQGVFISVAAGNDYYNYNGQLGLDYPAIDPNVVSVGAVYDGNFGSVAWASGARDYTTGPDYVASFSQRSSALSILAPGAMITTDYLNNSFASMAGTSMAAPVITGAAALIHQAMQANGLTANQSTILKDMQTTGVTIIDGVKENNNVVASHLAFKRINLSAAMAAIQKPNTAPVLQPIGNQTAAPGSTLQVLLNATDPSSSAITYSASVLANNVTSPYQLRIQLGLLFAGSYYTNSFGQNEKFLKSTGSTWYVIMPKGNFYRWTGSIATTVVPTNLVASLGASIYADPSLLWDAQPSTAGVPSVIVAGNHLVISTPANALGNFQIQVSASDGKLTTSQTFTLTVQAASALQVGSVANQSMTNGRSLGVALSATGGTGQAVTYQASVTGSYSTLPASFSVSGNQLTIYSSPTFVGTFTVQVTASSGATSASTTFQVTLTGSGNAQVVHGNFLGTGPVDTAFFNADGSWWVSVPQANGTFVNQNWGSWSAASNWKSILVGDFDHDGKTDVAGFNTNGSWWIGSSNGAGFVTRQWAQWSAASNWSQVQVGDFNNDGKTDVIGFNNNGSWWVGSSTGTAFTTNLWTQWSTATSWSSVQVLDVDGNSQLDIVGYNTMIKKWFVGYSNGTSFVVKAWTASAPPTSHSP